MWLSKYAPIFIGQVVKNAPYFVDQVTKNAPSFIDLKTMVSSWVNRA
jgi:hypothetical protein